jgi:PAS domain S-box-containing protein
MPEAVPDSAPVIRTDEHGRVVNLNAAAERVFGLECSAAMGRSVADLSPPAPSEAGRGRALLENAEVLAQIGSWEWMPAEDDLRWSANLYRIFGLAPGEITPTPEYVFERTHPEDRERVRRLVEQAAQGGTLAPLDYRIVRSDGGVRHLRATTLSVVEAREGAPRRLVGSVQDITEPRRAEREIAAHFAVAAALPDWDSLETGALRLLANLAQAMDYTVGILWVPQDDVLVARVVWQAEGEFLPEFIAESERARLPRGIGLPGRVWERREPIAVASPGKPPSNRRREAAFRDGLRGALALPAMAGDEVLAVVELDSREEPELTERLMRSLTGIGYEIGQFLARRRAELEPPRLTPRELEVLQIAAQGLSARETAERLVVSPATVKTHLENIYAKLGVSDKASAVAHGMRHGMIE